MTESCSQARCAAGIWTMRGLGSVDSTPMRIKWKKENEIEPGVTAWIIGLRVLNSGGGRGSLFESFLH